MVPAQIPSVTEVPNSRHHSVCGTDLGMITNLTPITFLAADDNDFRQGVVTSFVQILAGSETAFYRPSGDSQLGVSQPGVGLGVSVAPPTR